MPSYFLMIKYSPVPVEEFALLINEPLESAMTLSNRLREDVSNITLESLSEPLQLTTSIGLIGTDGGTDINELMHRADLAMYQAKDQGRAARGTEEAANSLLFEWAAFFI